MYFVMCLGDILDRYRIQENKCTDLFNNAIFHVVSNLFHVIAWNTNSMKNIFSESTIVFSGEYNISGFIIKKRPNDNKIRIAFVLVRYIQILKQNVLIEMAQNLNDICIPAYILGC